jgi:hypothetical protein
MSHPGADGMRFKTLFPFFDVRLARCVWEAPSHPWRHDKRLLRDAMEGHLPVEVLERPKTPLYVGIQNDHADNPRVQIALRPDTRRWRSELMTTARISAYVDVDQVRRLMESPSPNLAFPFVENSFTLAHWLRFGLATITHSDNEETHHDAEHASP